MIPFGTSNFKQTAIVSTGSGKCSNTSIKTMASRLPGDICRFSIGPKKTGTLNVFFPNSTTHGLISMPKASNPDWFSKDTKLPCPHPNSITFPGGDLNFKRVLNQCRFRSDKSDCDLVYISKLCSFSCLALVQYCLP